MIAAWLSRNALAQALIMGNLPTAQGTIGGKWVFVGALVLVLIWLIVLPRHLVGQAERVPPWWRNVRVWAIVICVLQIWIYWRFA